MSKSDFQKWLEDAKRKAIPKEDSTDMPDIPGFRISNNRYAKDASLEDRLTREDRQMLTDMGVLL